MFLIPIRNAWFWALVCACGVLCALFVRNRAKLAAYDAMVPYEIDIVANDAITGRPLPSFSISDQYPVSVRFPVVRSYADEARMRISGFGVFPFSVKVSSEGYESMVVELVDPRPLIPVKIKMK